MVGLFIQLLLVSAVSSACQTNPFFPGKVLPKGPNVIYGGNLTLTCDKHCYTGAGNASHMFIKEKSGGKLVTTYYPGHPQITVLSETSIRLDVGNVTRKASFTCFIEPPGRSQKLLDYTAVNDIGFPPGDATVSCQVYNFENMNCTARLLRGPIVTTNITMSFRIVPRFNSWQRRQQFIPCPRYDIELHSCYWLQKPGIHCEGRDEPVRISQIYEILVSASNVFGSSESTECVEVNHFVKPAPVQRLRAVGIGTRKLTLQFHIDKYTSPQVVEMSFTSKLHNGSITQKVDGANHNQSYVLDNLLPYATYTISVKTIPLLISGATKGFWSEDESIVVTMLTDVPSISPAIQAGSYKEQDCGMQCRKQCEADDKLLCRDITVFWPKIPDVDRNGVINGYELQLQSSSGSVQNFGTAGYLMSHNFILLKNESYLVQILASTEAGTSKVPSKMTIPAVHDAPASLQYVAASRHNSTAVKVKWAPESGARREDIQNYHLFWCEGDRAQCSKRSSNNIFTKTVDGNQEETHVSLRSHDDPGAFWYSVSSSHHVNGLEVGSAMATSDCLYQSENVLSPPTLVKTSGSQWEYSIAVEIQEMSCQEKNDAVTHFEIFYCKQHESNLLECTGTTHNQTVPASTRDVYITEDIAAKQKYLVWGRSVTPSGRSQEAADKITVETTGFTWEWALICCALVLAVVFGGIGVYFCVKRSRRVVKELNRPVNIVIPGQQQNGHVPSAENLGYDAMSPGESTETTFVPGLSTSTDHSEESDKREVRSSTSSSHSGTLSEHSTGQSYSKFALGGNREPTPEINHVKENGVLQTINEADEALDTSEASSNAYKDFRLKMYPPSSAPDRKHDDYKKFALKTMNGVRVSGKSSESSLDEFELVGGPGSSGRRDDSELGSSGFPANLSGSDQGRGTSVDSSVVSYEYRKPFRPKNGFVHVDDDKYRAVYGKNGVRTPQISEGGSVDYDDSGSSDDYRDRRPMCFSENDDSCSSDIYRDRQPIGICENDDSGSSDTYQDRRPMGKSGVENDDSGSSDTYQDRRPMGISGIDSDDSGSSDTYQDRRPMGISGVENDDSGSFDTYLDRRPIAV